MNFEDNTVIEYKQEYPNDSQGTKPQEEVANQDAGCHDSHRERDKNPDTPNPPKKLDSLPKMKPEKDPNKKNPFWKIFSIITLTILLILGGFVVFLIDAGRLQPLLNTTNEISNNYDFNPSINSPVTSNIENKFNNSFEINLELTDSLVDKICGNNS